MGPETETPDYPYGIAQFEKRGARIEGEGAGQVEWETPKWVDWFNTKRLLEQLGYITPKEAEDAYYEGLKTDDIAA